MGRAGFGKRACGSRAHGPCHAPRPSEEMVKMVLSRPCHPDDQFTTSILRHWCMRHDELLAEHIKSLLIKNNSLPRKRQRWDPGLQLPRHPPPALPGFGRHLVV